MRSRNPESKLVSLDALLELRAQFKSSKKTLVTTNGCFDVLHWGHISYLTQAAQLGEVLVVLINADESVKKLKGPERPLHPERIRALQLAGLESVDYVCIFKDDTPVRVLEKLKTDIHCKGGDYNVESLPEAEIVKKHGGKVVCLGLEPGYSTTSILRGQKTL